MKAYKNFNSNLKISKNIQLDFLDIDKTTYEEYRMINNIYRKDIKETKGFFLIFWSFIIDLIVLPCFLIILITFYRYKILQKKLNNKPVFSFEIYNEIIIEHIVFNSRINPHSLPIPLLKNPFSQHKLIVKEALSFLLDLPFIIIGIIIIVLIPWRVVEIINIMRSNWGLLGTDNKLNRNEFKDKEILQVRTVISKNLIRGILDYFIFTLFIIELLGIWRWIPLFRSIKEICITDLQSMKAKKKKSYLSKFDILPEIVLNMFFNVLLIDLFIIPFAIISIPWIWRWKYLYNKLKATNADHFSQHRKLIFANACEGLLELICVVAAFCIILTIWRLKTLKNLIKFANEQYKIVQTYSKKNDLKKSEKDLISYYDDIYTGMLYYIRLM